MHGRRRVRGKARATLDRTLDGKAGLFGGNLPKGSASPPLRRHANRPSRRFRQNDTGRSGPRVRPLQDPSSLYVGSRSVRLSGGHVGKRGFFGGDMKNSFAYTAPRAIFEGQADACVSPFLANGL